MIRETIETMIEEQIWFAKTMLKGQGKDVPYVRPLISQLKEPWEAVYVAMNDLKQHLKEINLWKDSHLNIHAGKLDSQPAHISE